MAQAWQETNAALYWKGFKSKSPFSLLGVIFFLVGFGLLILATILGAVLKEPYEKYNYRSIVDHGKSQYAIITGITLNNNINYNGIRPSIISYNYRYKDTTLSDKFQTLEEVASKGMKVKDSVKIMVYNGQSVIPSLQPFSFPMWIIKMIPLLFILIGVPLFLMGHIAGKRAIKENGR